MSNGNVVIDIDLNPAGITKGIQNIKSEMAKVRNSVPDDAFDTLRSAVQKTEKDILNFKTEMANMSSTGKFNINNLTKAQRALYDEMVKGNDELKSSLDSVEGKQKTFMDFINGIKTSTVAAFAVMAGAFRSFTSGLNNLGRIDDVSQQLGMSRTEFQKWDYVAKQSGINIESLGVAMKTLSDGAVSGSKALQTLGINAKDVNGNFKSQEQLFNETITALAKMPSGVQRTSLSVDLFGRSAMDLATVLNLTNEELDAMRSGAPIFSDEDVMAGDKLGDTLQGIKDNLLALATTSLVAMAEPLQTISDIIKDITKQGSETSEAMEAIGSAIASILNALAPIVKLLVYTIAPIIKVLAKGIEGIAKSVEYAAGGFGAWGKNAKDIFGTKAIASVDQYDRKIQKLTKTIEDYKKQGKEGDGIFWWQNAAADAPYAMQRWIDIEQKNLDKLKEQRKKFIDEQNKKSGAGSGTKPMPQGNPDSIWQNPNPTTGEVFLKDGAEYESSKSALATFADFYSSTIADLHNTSKDKLDAIAGVWTDMAGSVTDAMGSVGEALVTGQNPMKAFARSLLETTAAMLDAYANQALGASVADAIVNKNYSKIVEGLTWMSTLKLAAGVIRGTAGKFADGGIVPGTSTSGDKLLANVNSGELILNRAQQNNIAGQLSGNSVVINVINQANSKVDVQQTNSDNGKQIDILITSKIKSFLGSEDGNRTMKSLYGVAKTGQRT